MNKIEEIIEKFAYDKYHEVEDSRWFEPLQEGAKWMHDKILSNPSEFGLVSREESDKLQKQCDKLREALEHISDPYQYFTDKGNSHEMAKDLAHNAMQLRNMAASALAQQTLTEYEKLK